MICGKLAPSGALTDIGYRQPRQWDDGSTDVEVASIPTDPGPFTYDAATKAAVVTLTENDKLDRLGGRILAAIILKNSTQWASATAAQKVRIQSLIDGAAAGIIKVLL